MARMPNACEMLRRSVFVTLIVVTTVGCEWDRWGIRRPFPAPVVCVIPEGASKEEIVEHLNRSRAPLQSWRSTDIRFQVPGPAGVPLRLTASLAVEQPRNVRLIANSLRGNEADLGSNDERFWFWVRAEKSNRLYTASHDDAPLVFRQMQIPFQPEWMVQALGLGVLDPNQLELRPHQPGSSTVTLVANRFLPDGQSVEQHLTVDTCSGHIIEQALYDSQQQLLARAILGDYQNHSGIELPHYIELQSPRSGQTMTMKIGTLEVNPAMSLEPMWAFPRLQGTVVFDIGQAARFHMEKPRNSAPEFEDTQPFGGSGQLEQPVLRRTSALPDEPNFADEPNFSN